MGDNTVDLISFAEQMKRDMEEEIHPDLEPYLEEGVLGTQLRHPLVYSIPLISNGMANRIYEQKKCGIEKALNEGNFEQYVFLHERPYRVQTFKFIAERLTDIQYWKLLSNIWIDTESQWADLRLWKQLIGSKRPKREFLMNLEDLPIYHSLPETLTIYRGCQKGKNENGLSWTLDHAKAYWFATRYTRNSNWIVLERTIQKSEVIAVLFGRGEKEIIYLPKRGSKND